MTESSHQYGLGGQSKFYTSNFAGPADHGDYDAGPSIITSRQQDLERRVLDLEEQIRSSAMVSPPPY